MITQEEFDEFVKYYHWEYLRNPDYRVGQAFINWCPAVKRQQIAQEGHQDVDSTSKLFYNTSNEECWKYIKGFIRCDL
jgi:hypothetical protein